MSVCAKVAALRLTYQAALLQFVEEPANRVAMNVQQLSRFALGHEDAPVVPAVEPALQFDVEGARPRLEEVQAVVA